MKWKPAFAFAATVLCSAPALGTTFYEFDLKGQRTLHYYVFCGRLGCPPDLTTSWAGKLTLAVQASGDGIYSGGSVPLVTLTSDFISFTTDGFGAGGAGTVQGDEPGFTVGMQNGSVSFIEGQYWLDRKLDTGAIFNGLSVHGYEFNASGLGANWLGYASLTVRPIPEPSNFALLLGGLSFVGAMVRRRRFMAESEGGEYGPADI